MSHRRRSSIPGLRRKYPVLNLLVVLVLGLGAYWSKSSWPLGNKPVATAEQDEVLVERVVDGDTLVISGGDRIRLIGVDTPETHHPTKAVQPFGPEAAEFTQSMVEGKRVQLRFDPGETKDKYGRTLAYVYVDGRFLNEELVRAGLARALTNYPFSREMKQILLNAQTAAKAQKCGIWSLPEQKTDVSTRPVHKKAG